MRELLAPSKGNDDLAPLVITRDEPMCMCEYIRELCSERKTKVLSTKPQIRKRIKAREEVGRRRERRALDATRKGDSRDETTQYLQVARVCCPVGADRRADTPPRSTWRSVRVRRTCLLRCAFRALRRRLRCLTTTRPTVAGGAPVRGAVADVVGPTIVQGGRWRESMGRWQRQRQH
jgi:hypothetical protein